MTSLPDLGRRGEGWVVLQGVLIAAVAMAGWWLGSDWVDGPRVATTLVGLAAVLAGLALAIRGVRDLGGALTAYPHPREDADLVQTGVYRRARHPIYGGLVLGAVGWALGMASLEALAVVVLLWAFLRLKSRREEAWLADRFPGYPAYRERTRGFWPWP